jgi:hypothetical protein
MHSTRRIVAEFCGNICVNLTLQGARAWITSEVPPAAKAIVQALIQVLEVRGGKSVDRHNDRAITAMRMREDSVLQDLGRKRAGRKQQNIKSTLQGSSSAEKADAYVAHALLGDSAIAICASISLTTMLAVTSSELK